MNVPWTALGFDDWFAQRAVGLLQPALCPARVTAVDRDAFLVRNPEGESRAELAGKFRFTVQSALDLPCVGDWVGVQWPVSGGPALIHQVLPRKTFLRRKTPGKAVDFQMIAANLDVAFIIQAVPHDFNIPRLDRYLVMANEGRIAPQIVLSKTDLIAAEELARLVAEIRAAGITAPILPFSNITGNGLDEFRKFLAPGKTYGLLGSSGVGKSTLINRLAGQDVLETQAVSSTGEGTHTTTRRQLLFLDCGAMLIDTPGMRELGLLGTGTGMDTTFRDIGDYAAQCRFPDCTHTQEPGCAVLAALEVGELGDDRYQNYLKLKKETDFHNLSYTGKRQKDRAFGKFIKAAKKQMRK
jgi:ribosome biogenesis GTPase